MDRHPPPHAAQDDPTRDDPTRDDPTRDDPTRDDPARNDPGRASPARHETIDLRTAGVEIVDRVSGSLGPLRWVSGRGCAWAATGPPSATEPATEPAGAKPAQKGLKSLPEGERPRERLLKDGGAALTDAELLAVLLRTGRPGQTAVEMAQEILDERGGLGGLVWSDPRSLRRHGLAKAKSATVLAGLELARRLVRVQLTKQQNLLDSPGAVCDYLRLRFGRLDQEVMGALFVDAKNRLLGETEVFRGTMTRASAEPRAILREAILCGAAGVIVFHTHPSGDPAPSLHDLEFTKRMAKASDLLGVRLLDHLIVGAVGSWVSMRRRRDW